MMCEKTVLLGGHPITKSTVSVFVPLTGRTVEELEREAGELSCCDAAEWRVDHFLTGSAPADLAPAYRALCGRTDLPIIFTYRSHGEGGEHKADEDDYFALLNTAIDQKLGDAIDIELFHDRSRIDQLIILAREAGLTVILSNHDFTRTPDDDELERRMLEMVRLGADIAKIACMPQSKDDVIRMLNLSARMSRTLDCPLVAISMGRLGLITRVAGELFGSNISFGSGVQASAPGQIKACELRQLLDLFSIQ
ncbi:MAG: type I 3-dehydroquinate dehydratase [Fastidiosipilaceae bacterium]|jgi:3-dehydroquinate dehydratase-1